MNNLGAPGLLKPPFLPYRGPMPDDSPSLPLARSDLVDHGTSLFLDFDGTLVELAERPDAVVPAPGLRDLIVALTVRLAGQVAIVSGRPAREILDYLHGEEGSPAFAIAGSHGVEMLWSDGRRELPPVPAQLNQIYEELTRFVQDYPGVSVEQKPFGAGLHYRRAADPDAGRACATIADAIAARTGFTIQHGKMVVELRGPGPDKGDAVQRFLSEPPMQNTRPIFVGDDLTDEAGFEAASRLGGFGILVGPPRASAAAYRLPDVAAVLLWLSSIAGVSA